MLDMSRVIKLLDRVDDDIDWLDGINLRDLLVKDQQLSARKAEVSRRLLWTAQLLDNARLEVLNQYHEFRGEENVPHIT